MGLDLAHQVVPRVPGDLINSTMKIKEIDTQSSHAEAVRDREALQRASEKINENRSTARAFLQRVGIITPSGKLRKAYR